MSTLLLHLQGNKTLNRTIFPPHLYIYNDLLIYKKRKLLTSREMTISYNQISQVTLNKNIFFAHLDIITTGTDDILIKWLSKDLAKKAKTLIDQKIYFAHAKHNVDKNETNVNTQKFEKSLARINELLAKGEIDQKEFNRLRSVYLSQLK